MSERTRYEISIRDVPPHPEAVRLTGQRDDGLPDGIHTGGAWLHNNMVYKPLDGRPWINADFHLSTDEEQCLTEMQGQPLFPKNWRIEQINGRRFLVREKAIIISKNGDIEPSQLSAKNLAEVESGIRALNENNWEINDPVSLGIDRDHQLFLVDLSIAGKVSPIIQGADDYWRFERFCNLANAPAYPKLRQAGRHYLSASWRTRPETHEHIYGSFNRPVSLMWAALLRDDQFYLEDAERNFEKRIPYTFICSVNPLPVGIIDQYELEWMWSPLKYKKFTT